ncbi:metallophosphoesterase family protein [Rhizohabitans arisaemae]|uniref:metallophosphoesterase family protein n=1 Tax=Rhizohabitans arisaemae TaxID=2720610 RepID=UPI0024B18C14|nr:metallophosphoesterase [Rhizohabitans arisaemae]
MERQRLRSLISRIPANPVVRWTTVVVVAVLGAWLGLAVSGPVQTSVGPAEIGMSLTPSWTGDTVVDVRPLGTLGFDSHDGPLALRVTIDAVHPEKAREFIDDPKLADKLPERFEANVAAGVRTLLLKSAAFAVLGAVVAGFVVFRRLSRAAWSAAAATVVLIATAGVGLFTFQPSSIVEPRYTGLLTGAPSLVGSAESIVLKFSQYRSQLAKLVNNVGRLYEASAKLPVYPSDPETIRVLHVSDIHINPIAWSVIRSLIEQFKIDLVVDTGDLTDHGTAAENRFTEEIGRLGVPYVWVRGNHDSMVTQRAVARQRGAVVLDGDAVAVAGLRIYGVGDPRFTPDKSLAVLPDEGLAVLGREHAVRLARALPEGGLKPPVHAPAPQGKPSATPTPGKRSVAKPARLPPIGPDSPFTTPIDVVAVHDSNIGKEFSGATPLVLAGHTHRRSAETLPTGTELLVQGSTGGAGLRGLEHEEPTQLQASVLYFSKETRRLQARDDITLGGYGEQSAQIQRVLAVDPGRTISPRPIPSPTGTGSAVVTPGFPSPKTR